MYKFRLEPVLQYRKRLEEKAQAELSQGLIASEKAKANLRQLEDERQSLIQELKVKAGEEVPVPDYLISRRYIDSFSSRIEECQKKLEEIQKAIQEKKRLLITRSKEKKILECLKGQERERYQEDIKKLEQKFHDEMTTVRFKKTKGQDHIRATNSKTHEGV